jgi:hypothetical protein
MSENVKKIISDYYNELQHAFNKGTIDFTKLHLDEKVSVIGPNEKFEGKKAVEEMYGQFIHIVSHFDIQRQYFDHESCCTVMNCVTRKPPIPIVTIEWILVRNGKIVEIHPVYDTDAWNKVMQAQAK